MNFKNTILFAFLAFCFGLNAQQTEDTTPPSIVTTVESMIHVSSVASRMDQQTPPIVKEEQMMDGRSSRNNVVPGKGSTGEDILAKYKSKLEGKIQGKSVDLVFQGAVSSSQPTDPSLAVGPNHVMVVYNTGYRIFDKDGESLWGPFAPNPSIFPNGGCCDLTVSYDNQADRWVLSFLGSGLQVAVSDGPDPVNDGWYVYNIPGVADYNKLSVWSDGYYITENTGGSNKLWVMERDAMLAGDPGAQVLGFPLPGMVTSGFHSPQAFNISNDNFPAAGSAPIVYMQDDAWGGVATGNDHIKMWLADMNWTSPGSSTVSAAIEFPVTAYTSVFDGGSFSNLPQPGGGTTIDALQATIMNQAQFRKFSTHNSAVFNFVVDVDPSGAKLAGIRWYEFRQDGDGLPWSIFQEGTYTSPNGKHAWHGSLIMDFQGNIGMGYTAMDGDDNTTLGSYYTGRFGADAAGTMSIAEETIIVGNANIPGTRYGDYSKIDVDPIGDKRFYFINELMNSGRKDMVGRFQIASDFTNDIGAVAIDPPVSGALTATEAITVTIFNYGLGEASGFTVNYQVDGGTVVTEAFIGTIPSGTAADFTFVQTADLSIEGQVYTLTAFTSLASDEFADNDSVTEEVTHLSAVDSGTTEISSPASGSGLSATENITIEITNFGSATQTSIPVYYTVNGGTAVTETYTGSIAQDETDTYTFTTTADFSELGDYDVCSGTQLTGDGEPTNDETCSVVSNFICQPVTDCAGFNDGVTEFQLVDQDVSPECSESGYTDNTDIVFNFILEDNPFEGILEVGFSATSAAIWIDFNDNSAFEDDEMVLETIEFTTADIEYDFEIDFADFANTTEGMHLMRLRGLYTSTGSETGPCDDLTYGRTNDFTANISGSVGLEENDFAASELNIKYLPGDQFQLTFNTSSYNESLPVTIFTPAGQTLAFYTLQNNGSGYSKTLDMSHVAAGVYFVKVGNDNLNKVKRIIVE